MKKIIVIGSGGAGKSTFSRRWCKLQPMGVLTIEIPQEINRSFRLDDSEFSAQIIDELETHASGRYRGNVRPPRRNDRKEALKEVLGIWSDRPESADEIAKHLRRLNNGLE